MFVDPGIFLQECDVKEHWVCGSNGRSYRNHCELHRDACITKTKIHAEHKGPCLGNFSPMLAEIYMMARTRSFVCVEDG